MKYIVRVIFLEDFQLYLEKSKRQTNNVFLEKLDNRIDDQQFYYFVDSHKNRVKQRVYRGNYLDCINAIEQHKKYSEASNLAYEIWPETLLEYIDE